MSKGKGIAIAAIWISAAIVAACINDTTVFQYATVGTFIVAFFWIKEKIMSSVEEELKGGGNWLGAARRWIQNNIPRGDSIVWSSHENVSVPFNKLQELAQEVAIAAVEEDRQKRETLYVQWHKFDKNDESTWPSDDNIICETGMPVEFSEGDESFIDLFGNEIDVRRYAYSPTYKGPF